MGSAPSRLVPSNPSCSSSSGKEDGNRSSHDDRRVANGNVRITNRKGSTMQVVQERTMRNRLRPFFDGKGCLDFPSERLDRSSTNWMVLVPDPGPTKASNQCSIRDSNASSATKQRKRNGVDESKQDGRVRLRDASVRFHPWLFDGRSRIRRTKVLSRRIVLDHRPTAARRPSSFLRLELRRKLHRSRIRRTKPTGLGWSAEGMHRTSGRTPDAMVGTFRIEPGPSRRGGRSRNPFASAARRKRNVSRRSKRSDADAVFDVPRRHDRNVGTSRSHVFRALAWSSRDRSTDPRTMGCVEDELVIGAWHRRTIPLFVSANHPVLPSSIADVKPNQNSRLET